MAAQSRPEVVWDRISHLVGCTDLKPLTPEWNVAVQQWLSENLGDDPALFRLSLLSPLGLLRKIESAFLLLDTVREPWEDKITVEAAIERSRTQSSVIRPDEHEGEATPDIELVPDEAAEDRSTRNKPGRPGVKGKLVGRLEYGWEKLSEDELRQRLQEINRDGAPNGKSWETCYFRNLSDLRREVRRRL